MMKYGFTAPDMTVHEFIEDELPSVTPSINIEKLKTINKYCYEYGRQDGRNECRRKGHWIVFDHGLGCKYYKCDKCGNTVQMPRNNPYNGCPYCFAEMESEE